MLSADDDDDDNNNNNNKLCGGFTYAYVSAGIERLIG